jgi:enoyl-CoA hydratase/carnithine racemase
LPKLNEERAVNAEVRAASLVEIEHDAYGVPGVVRVTMNRPDAFNALSKALLDALQSTLTALAQSSARVVVIAGDFIDAVQARQQGLVNRVVPADALEGVQAFIDKRPPDWKR